MGSGSGPQEVLVVHGRTSIRINPSRSRLLAALALLAFAIAAALASAPARAGADPGDAKKPTGSPANAAVEADQAPDRSARGRVGASPAAGRALTVIQRRIAEYVAQHGTSYTFASYLDSDTGRIVLETNAPAPVVSGLTSMSDADQRREVGKAQIRRASISDTWHRRDDVQPFWGGAGITNSGGLCSSGYAVRNSSGTVFSVTAGHCFANGANALVESGLRSYGTVSGRRLPTVTGHAMDMELLGGQTYAGRVYTGGVFSTTSRPVTAAGAAFEGYSNYCHSGRTTGENCGHTATDTEAQVCTQSGCKSPVIAFTGGTMIQGGDSGGAFYAIDSSGRAWIRGHVIATNGTTGWAQPWTTVASQYGVSIVTG
jgi:hypothetical protein